MSKKAKSNQPRYRASKKIRRNYKQKKRLSTEQVSNRILAIFGLLTLLLGFLSVRTTMGESSPESTSAEAYPAPQSESVAIAYTDNKNPVPLTDDTLTDVSYTNSVASSMMTSGGQITDRGFTGHKHDDELGLIYMNGRYYVPSIGRFVSPDPVVPNPANPQAWNRYSYVYNNPVTLSDPTGNIPCYMYCPGESYNPVQGQFMANYAGPWDVDQQRANAARAEAIIRGTAETAVGMAWEPADWGIALSDGFQWYDGIGMLPVIPAAVGRWGDDALSWISTILRNADDRILRWGLEGSIETAQAAARNGDILLPGLFKYGSDMPSISGYQRHHLWPEGLGGPRDGWSIYVQSSPNNFHTASGGIQPWLDQQLMGRTGLGLNEMREWARSNPDQLLPMLREIYLEIGIDFPY